MRRYRAYLFPLLSVLLILSSLSYGQSWSGILPSSRAVDWSRAGLPTPTLPDGEPTNSRWEPPPRTSICSTINPSGDTSGSTDTTAINNAITGCANTNTIKLNAGTFYITRVNLYRSNVTLRGSGPQQTILRVASGGQGIYLGAEVSTASGLVTSGSNLTQGSQTITVGSVSGGSFNAGYVGLLQQCDTGYTGDGSGGCSGSYSDNGGLYICGGAAGTCNTGFSDSNRMHQVQTFRITSVTNNGNGTYTMGLDPPILMPNWNYSQGPVFQTYSPSYSPTGVGLEDVTIDTAGATGSDNQIVYMGGANASWIKGVRIVGMGTTWPIQITTSANGLLANNYVYVQSTGGTPQFVMSFSGSSNFLLLNNTWDNDGYEGMGSNSGNVLAYNYTRSTHNPYMDSQNMDHHPGSSLYLFESNQVGKMLEDDWGGTHDLDTYFRNQMSCTDYSPYIFSFSNANGMIVGDYNRFANVIANVIGSSLCNTGYQNRSYPSGYYTPYNLPGTDALAYNSLMRWGNVDIWSYTQNSGTAGAPRGARFESSEVPTTLTGNASPFTVPTITKCTVSNLASCPASFFMNNMGKFTNGGTGLSWWKVCDSWTTFPTSCAHYTTQPMPPNGPDVTGGQFLSGYANDVPAAVAWKGLPVDTRYQGSYTVTGSSWSGGKETLTISGLPGDTTPLIGGFRLTGANSACLPTAGSLSYTGGSDNEILMTGSSGTTVSYALASNPNTSCNGTVLWPDVRQFDERVYQSDTGGSGTGPNAPTGLSAIVQ